jgi:phosphoenolpyruvate phosphomutase
MAATAAATAPEELDMNFKPVIPPQRDPRLAAGENADAAPNEQPDQHPAASPVPPAVPPAVPTSVTRPAPVMSPVRSKAPHLRHRLRHPEVIRVAGAHDALSALVAEDVGFDAVWASSLAISAARGLPDMSLLTMTDYLQVAAHINDVCGIPVIADCDTGFGNTLNVAYMVRQYEAAGIAAVCIEDKLFPKRNSFVPTDQPLEDADVFARKIEIAKQTQRTDDFLVIARTEAAIAGAGVDEALRRAHRYVDAGADAVLMHSKSPEPDEVLSFLEAWQRRAPVVVVPTTYYHWHVDDATKAGVSMVIYANQALRASVLSMKDALGHLVNAGSSVDIEEHIAPMGDIFRLQRVDEWLELES